MGWGHLRYGPECPNTTLNAQPASQVVGAGGSYPGGGGHGANMPTPGTGLGHMHGASPERRCLPPRVLLQVHVYHEYAFPHDRVKENSHKEPQIQTPKHGAT